jgi:hypothetical protein
LIQKMTVAAMAMADMKVPAAGRRTSERYDELIGALGVPAQYRLQ